MDIRTELEFEERFDEIMGGLLAPTSAEWEMMKLSDQLQYAQAVALTQIARKLEHILLRMQHIDR
jgi:hypothetical protein